MQNKMLYFDFLQLIPLGLAGAFCQFHSLAHCYFITEKVSSYLSLQLKC